MCLGVHLSCFVMVFVLNFLIQLLLPDGTDFLPSCSILLILDLLTLFYCGSFLLLVTNGHAWLHSSCVRCWPIGTHLRMPWSCPYGTLKACGGVHLTWWCHLMNRDMISPLRYFSGQSSLNNLEDCEWHSSMLDWAFDIIQHEFENTFATLLSRSVFCLLIIFPMLITYSNFQQFLRSINLIPNNSFFFCFARRLKAAVTRKPK